VKLERLAKLTLGQAEDYYSTGLITQVEYEAYRRAWADAGGTRMGYRGAVGWSTPSDDPDVELLAADIVRYADKVA
jgi:hypothetical protein